MAFVDFLDTRETNKLLKIALTDKSYRNIDHNIGETEVNSDLATLGDSILGFVVKEYLFDRKTPKISEESQRYLSDEALVSVIGRYFSIRDYLLFDPTDKTDGDYNWAKKKKNHCKYIATAVEACLGAIYKLTPDGIDVVKAIVIDEFMPLIERHCHSLL